MRNRTPVEQVGERAARALRDIPWWTLRMKRAVAAAHRNRLHGRGRNSSVLDATSALEMVARLEIARALASGLDCEDALLKWARMVLAHHASSVIGAYGLNVVYAVGIHHLLEDSTGLARAKKLVRWSVMQDDTLNAECADVLAFLPRSMWPHPCAAKPEADFGALARAISERRVRGVASATKALVGLYERGGRGWFRESPFSWIPLPLLLAREQCREAGLAWTDPDGPSWTMWRTFRPTRRRRKVPAIERDVLALVREMRPYVRSRRARYEAQRDTGPDPKVEAALNRAVGRAVDALVSSRELAAVFKRLRKKKTGKRRR